MTELKQWFKSRREIYALLAAAYRRDLDNTLKVFKQTPLITTLANTMDYKLLKEVSENILGEFGQYKDDESYLAKLSAEYDRLFVGPAHLKAPPWESVYLTKEKLLFGEPTFQVKDFYQSFGLIVTTSKNEPEDHISLELAFMSELCRQYLDNHLATSHVLQGQYQFLEEHLLKWIPLWTKDIFEHSKMDFWRYLGVMTDCWLQDDFNEISELMAELKLNNYSDE